MIYIEENNALKLPGITNLFVNVSYNDEYSKSVLRQLDFRYYHKDIKKWEVPITKLSYLISMLSTHDDIELKVLKEKQTPSFSIPSNYPFKTKPYQYQIDGINYGLNHDCWLLLDEMGLGKTLQILYLAEFLKDKGQLQHCLIICGVNSLKYNWLKEIEKHSRYDAMILGTRYTKNGKSYIGSMKDRIDDLLSPIKEFFIITNIETLRDNKIIEALKKQVNVIDMVAIDEAHKAKSPTSIQGKNLLKLSWPKRKIALTGTILLNSPLDAYVPLKWTGNEKATFSKFKELYCEYGGFRGVQIIGYKNLDLLHEQIKINSIRRKKSDVLDLPPKTYHLEYVEMNDLQEKFYKDIKQGVIDELDKVKVDPAYAMSLSFRLRQATAFTGILSSTIMESAKLDRLEDLVEEIIAEGNKVVVFSTFKPTLKEVERRLNLKNINNVICDGDVKDSLINERKDRFEQDPNCKVLLGTWQKMGTGFTLTAANYLIFIDTPFTDGLFQQAADRIYRIGATKNVTIITLITKDTVDERIQDIIEGKAALSDFVVDGNIANEKALNFINFLLK